MVIGIVNTYSTPAKPIEQFRDYARDDVSVAVRNHYLNMRSKQTLDYVLRMKKKYLTFDKPMTIWTAMERLNELIDVSDPDLNLPNVEHLMQSAEAIRADGRPEWMQLVGLIHDLGKVLFIFGCDEDGTSAKEQWGLVGDVFAVGCALPSSCVYNEFNTLNPDMSDPRYNTETGIYTPGCGIDDLHLAWGHDEYLYQVLSHHPTNKLPKAAMNMIRYHSFYPWHTGGAYEALRGSDDAAVLNDVKDFNKYDLYSKCPKRYTIAEMKERYERIAAEWLGEGAIMW